MSESKTKDVMKPPKNVRALQRFLGFANCFSKFIENYAILAKPLGDLLRNEVKFEFGAAQQNAFESLRSKIIQRPVLMIYQPDVETELHTDASKFGISAILFQRSKEDNEFHPVFFISKKTTREEEKWFRYELEMYAICHAMTKLRNYLADIPFIVVTDCLALKTCMEKRTIRKVAAWILELQSFNFKITHHPGTKMKHVDALSRMFVWKTDSLILQLKRAQETDEHVIVIKELLKKGNYKDYVINNGLLCKYDNANYQIVVPEMMQMGIVNRAQQEGHFKHQKLEAMIAKEFFIPNLSTKTDDVVKNCIQCILCDRKAGKQEGLLHPIAKEPVPFDTFHMDHLGSMPSTNKNYNHILAIVDAFTKFIWLFPVKSTTTAGTLAKLKVVTNIFGNPKRILADKGTAFSAHYFKNFCNEEGIELSLSTTGVHRGNGQIERMHRIVIASFAKLSIENPERWFMYVDRVQRFLNATHQRAINTIPFELMFGTKMRN